MPPPLRIPLLKGERLDGGVDYRDALPINTLAVLKPVFDAEGYMVTHPGLGEFATVPGRDRGAVFNERQKIHFRVSDNDLIRLQFTGATGDFDLPKGVATVLGTISGANNPRWSQAVMPYSFNSQAIVTDLKMWLYTGSGLEEITDPDLGQPIDCIWIDGYYFLTDGEFLYHSNLADDPPADPNDFIDPDQFATSEFSPDPTLALVKTQDNQVMVLNRYTTEYFFDTGKETGFAFQRVPAKAIQSGIVGTHLKVEIDGIVFCVGSAKKESPTMLVMAPGQVGNFATREIDKILAEYTESELASEGTMETRTQERNVLIYVRLPRHTLCYNHTASKKFGKDYAWSIMQSSIDGVDDPWTAVNGVYDALGNSWIYGHRSLGLTAALGGGAQQYGEAQEVTFHTPFVLLEGQSINELQIETVPGYTDDEILPVFLSLTYDGHIWGREWAAQYGGKAEYDKRFIVNRLGYIRHWFAFRLRTVTKFALALCRMTIDHG